MTEELRKLRQRVRDLEEWLDTITSPLPRRLWWWCCGYRFRRVGRWYGKTEDLR